MSAIEDNAVRVFSHIIGRTKRLDPMIDTGDRTPLTDGHIEIYRDEHNQGGSYKLGDRNCIGRLTVQVKGKIASSLSSFSMKREHLEGIEAIGGVVLLVAVLRKSDLRPKKLYYADLNVRNTKALLEQMRDGQKTKAVPLRKFPRKPDAVYGLVCYLRESQKNQPIPLEVSSLKELTGMSLTVLREVDMSKRQVFGAPGSSDIVTVRTPSGHDQAIDTVLYFVPEDYLLHDIEGLEVSCGDITFHRIRRRKLNDREVEVFFSPGLSFVFGLESDPETGDRDVKVNFHTQRRLYYALQDLRFLKNMASGSVIEFDSSPALRYQPRGNADDLEYGISCAVAAWTRAGIAVDHLLMTAGEAGMQREPAVVGPLRTKEQQRACDIVGVDDLSILDFPDGHMENGLPLRKAIAAHIRRRQPDVVVTSNFDLEVPWGLNHVDHRITGVATVDAIRDAGNRWFFPELVDANLQPWSASRLLIGGVAEPDAYQSLDDEALEQGIASLEAHEEYLADLPDHPAPRAMLTQMATALPGVKLGIGFRSWDM